MTLSHTALPSPVGRLTLIASSAGLAAILWENDNPLRVRLGETVEDAGHPVLKDTQTQLNEYFAGRRRSFSIPLDFRGTQFQQSVWRALLTIPFGETRSYSQLAAQIGKPDAARAVGAANGKNPGSIIAPCHRVIGANGALTGFAGGVEAKIHLLKLEGQALNPKAAAGFRHPRHQILASDTGTRRPEIRRYPVARSGRP